MEKLNEALQLKHKGNLEAARTLLVELAATESNNATVHYYCATIHDNLGLEREAVPYYEKALQLGLNIEETRGALLGLGSTYRTLGMYEEAESTLKRGIEDFPNAREFYVFYAMVQYNLGNYNNSVSILLKELVNSSNEEDIKQYHKAISFYADHLDDIWE